MVGNIRRTLYVAVLFLVSTATLHAQSQAAPTDTLKTDTLREVTVRPHSGVRLPFTNSTQSEVNGIVNAEKYSLNGLIQRYAPTLHDQIMHPFGFAERKKKRKRKKVERVLEQYDAIDAVDPLRLLLDSVAKVQGLTVPDRRK